MYKYIQRHKYMQVIISILITLVICALGALIFLKTWPPFGGSPNAADKRDYAARAENYYDDIFHSLDPFTLMHATAGSDENAISHKGEKPLAQLPTARPEIVNEPDVDYFSATWLGHSTLLIQMHGMNILIDPMFSDRASPMSNIGGPTRYSPLPIMAAELPDIDIVIITHDHYDHLDYRTIKQIDSKVTRYIMPLGVEKHFEKWGIADAKLIDMAWWEEIEINGLTIGCVPGRHHSGRGLTNTYSTLWASWALVDEYHKVFDSGDTGFGGQFELIHEKYGDFDIAFTDCAQYNMRWRSTHMFPEQAVEAMEILGAKYAVPIHWGAFSLSNHAWDDPVERFIHAAAPTAVTPLTPMIGQTIRLGDIEMSETPWWRDIE